MRFLLGVSVLLFFNLGLVAADLPLGDEWELTGCVRSPSECYYSCDPHRMVYEKDESVCPLVWEAPLACYCSKAE